mmetsp:Transcript_2666/g.5866  ORF Transcript_2666/g.5866 Transcript_2666/m.5866 type:complete len:118 (+) Transcript_2666:129-482(+)
MPKRGRHCKTQLAEADAEMPKQRGRPRKNPLAQPAAAALDEEDQENDAEEGEPEEENNDEEPQPQQPEEDGARIPRDMFDALQHLRRRRLYRKLPAFYIWTGAKIPKRKKRPIKAPA